MYLPASSPNCPTIGERRACSSAATTLSIMALPAKTIFPSATPSRSRLSVPDCSVVNSRSETASATILLISSGMVRSKLRNPASTWASRNQLFGSHQRARHGGVHIPGHQNHVRAFGPYQFAELLQDLRRLRVVCAGTDVQIVVRLTQLELIQKNL